MYDVVEMGDRFVGNDLEKKHGISGGILPGFKCASHNGLLRHKTGSLPLLQRGLQVGWGTEARLKFTHTDIIYH